MYQVGDLVRYVPYNNEHPGSWVMYGGLGIIVSIITGECRAVGSGCSLQRQNMGTYKNWRYQSRTDFGETPQTTYSI